MENRYTPVKIFIPLKVAKEIRNYEVIIEYYLISLNSSLVWHEWSTQ